MPRPADEIRKTRVNKSGQPGQHERARDDNFQDVACRKAGGAAGAFVHVRALVEIVKVLVDHQIDERGESVRIPMISMIRCARRLSYTCKRLTRTWLSAIRRAFARMTA